MGVLPDEIKSRRQGVSPPHVPTGSLAGTPNVTALSHVYYVDADHVALSFQFFNKAIKNVRENPRAVAWIISPQRFDSWDL